MRNLYAAFILLISVNSINIIFLNNADAQVQGTVLMSSETVRNGLIGGSPVTYPVYTNYNNFSGNYYLENHNINSVNSALYCYDATGYTDPASAGVWFSSCTEPTCYSVNQINNSWLTGDNAYHASDYRNAQKILEFFSSFYGRNGADNNGENLIILSGVNYNNATAMGMYRSIALGKPDYANGKPSFGTIGIIAHEFAHIMSWHEWVGLFSEGSEGTIYGVKGIVDEHLANLFGTICTYYNADESWISNTRWAFDAERYYGDNYSHRNDSEFYNTMNIIRNPYLGTDAGTSRAYVSQIYCGLNDQGGIHTNAVLLDRAAYLFTEGGFGAMAPDSTLLANWPAGAPNIHVLGIGMDRLAKIAYDIETTASFSTHVGNIGLGDITEAEQDTLAMKTELVKFAYIVLASAEHLTTDFSWPSWVPISVRNGFAAVGLIDADRDYDGILDSTDNCPNTFNPGQVDADGDGIGNVCDTAGIPALIYPFNNFVTGYDTVNLSWNNSIEAITYELGVSTDTNFITIILDSATISDTTFILNNLTEGTNYFWHVKATNATGTSKWSEVRKFSTAITTGIYENYENDKLWLKQNYPNPFNGHSSVEFNLPVNGKAQIILYNLLGKQTMLLDQSLNAGIHKIDISKNDFAEGMWFYQLKANGNIITKKMIIK
jgi:hypothetical protein